MEKIKKGLNTKILSIMISILLSSNIAQYCFADALRISIGEYGRMIECLGIPQFSFPLFDDRRTIGLSESAKENIMGLVELEAALENKYNIKLEIPAYGIIRYYQGSLMIVKIVLPQKILAFNKTGKEADMCASWLATALDHDDTPYLRKKDSDIYLYFTGYDEYAVPIGRYYLEKTPYKYKVSDIFSANFDLSSIIQEPPAGENRGILERLEDGESIPIKTDWDATVSGNINAPTKYFYGKTAVECNGEDSLAWLHSHPNRVNRTRELILGRFRYVLTYIDKLPNSQEESYNFIRVALQQWMRVLELSQPILSNGDLMYTQKQVKLEGGFLGGQVKSYKNRIKYVGTIATSPFDNHRILMIWPIAALCGNEVTNILENQEFPVDYHSYTWWLDLVEEGLSLKINGYQPSEGYKKPDSGKESEEEISTKGYIQQELNNLELVLSNLALFFETAESPARNTGLKEILSSI